MKSLFPSLKNYFSPPLLATTEKASEIYFTGHALGRVRIALLTTLRKYCINPHVAAPRALLKPFSLHYMRDPFTRRRFTSEAAHRRIPCQQTSSPSLPSPPSISYAGVVEATIDPLLSSEDSRKEEGMVRDNGVFVFAGRQLMASNLTVYGTVVFLFALFGCRCSVATVSLCVFLYNSLILGKTHLIF